MSYGKEKMISFRMPEKQIKAMKAKAKKESKRRERFVSFSAMMREAVDKYLGENK